MTAVLKEVANKFVKRMDEKLCVLAPKATLWVKMEKHVVSIIKERLNLYPCPSDNVSKYKRPKRRRSDRKIIVMHF